MLRLRGHKITKWAQLMLHYCAANFIPKISAAILHCGMTLKRPLSSDQHGG
ncbi:hypothetical protein ACFQ3C_13095 [Seohaeicola saemankumensis]|uniref:Uncharacterized protein n=1 Tax=Seohaeicola saemankumensis TaxID=481181 RepID=A0ABW3TEJ4_9RHOB